MEVLRYERAVDSVFLVKARSLVLLALLSTISLSGCSQDEQCVDQEEVVAYDTIPHSSLLDGLSALDKSILYYHIAKNKEWIIDICEAVECVLSYKERISDIVVSSGVPLDTAMALMLTESRGILNAKSISWALGPWQIMPGTAKPYDKYYAWWKSGDKRCDLERSTGVAMKEIVRNYNEMEDWSLAFATYHMWIGNMRKLRALYKESTWKELCSFDQLYATMPPQNVIDWLATKNDDTFGYWIKIRNALTLLHLFEEDRPYFDHLESQYRKLSYDSRGIVTENLVLSKDDFLQTDADVKIAVQAGLLQKLDHPWFVCGNHNFENFLHADVQDILTEIWSVYGKDVSISCGLLPRVLWGDTPIFINKKQTLRLGSHSSGRTFDIAAPTNGFVVNKRWNKKLVWSSDYNRLEMALTLLRYQGKIVWCGELDPDGKKVLHFHITVLPSHN